MATKLAVIPVLALALAVPAARPAEARGAGEALAIGAIAVIAGCAASGRCRPGPGPGPVRAPDPMRETYREDQRALNYFNYGAGPEDGVPGRGTRAAIRNFEAEMGFYADGQLDQNERAFLHNAYHQGLSGGFGRYGQAYAQGGPRGYLHALNRDRQGLPPINGGGDRVAEPRLPAPIPAPVPVPVPPPGRGPFDPLPTGTVSASVNQTCEDTNRLSLANGGLQTADRLTNVDLAMKEQFCLARAFTQASGEARLDTVQGMTAEDVRQRCDQVAVALRPAMDSAGNGDAPAQAIASVRTVAGQMAPRAMIDLGEICLGLGFSADKAEVSLAASMLLVAADRPSYAELVGHHLRGGFGVPANEGAARAWFDHAMSAASRGAASDILPGQAATRNDVIRAALGGVGLNADLANQVLPGN